MVCLEPRCGINQIICDEYFALVPITCSYTCRQKSASAIVTHSGLLMRRLYSISSCCTASFSSCKPWAKTPCGTVRVAGSSANHGLWHICWASVRACVCVCVLIEWMHRVCVPSPVNSIKSLCFSTTDEWIILFGFALVLMVYSAVRWPGSWVS